MTYSTLALERKDSYAVVRLNRPDAMNALSIELLKDLDLMLGQIEKDDQIRGIILTGTGEKAFAAGADIEELHQLDGTTGKEYSERGQAVFSRIERFSKPVIAAVNGFALGGGCELAMACHIRLASDNAKFGQPEVNLGIIPGFGGTQRLGELIGVGRAIEYNLTGDLISSDRAEFLGLANHVYPQDQLLAEAEKMMATILAKGPAAVTNALNATMQSRDLSTDEGMVRESDLFGETCGTEDFKEGTKAFLEKRKPEFTGE